MAATRRAVHPICWRGVAGAVPLFPDGRVECCGALDTALVADSESGELHSNTEVDIPSELATHTFILHPGRNIPFEVEWLDQGRLLDQRLSYGNCDGFSFLYNFRSPGGRGSFLLN